MSLPHALDNAHAQKRWPRLSARYFPPILSLLHPTADPAIFFQISQHFYLPNVCTVLFPQVAYYRPPLHVGSPLPSIFLYILYHFNHSKLLSNCVIARVSSCRTLSQLTREISHALLPISYFPYFSNPHLRTKHQDRFFCRFLVLTAPLWGISTKTSFSSSIYLIKMIQIIFQVHIKFPNASACSVV